MSRAFDLFKILAPPLGNTAAEVRQWRWVMASTVYGLVIAFVVHLAWISGAIPGVDGNASATEVAELSKELKMDRQQRLETDIFNTRRRQCIAGGALRDAYATELSKLMGQWRALTHSETGPELLDCADLGGNGE